jgi:hypothetical protein
MHRASLDIPGRRSFGITISEFIIINITSNAEIGFCMGNPPGR